MNEQWKEIKGNREIYEISNLGNVRTKDEKGEHIVEFPKPASREMTLDEIEKELGYKVKIINKKK